MNGQSPLAELALARWAPLAELNANAERAELRAAGVAARTIDTLCPNEFADLVPGLISVLTGDYLTQVGSSEDWRGSRNAFSKMQRDRFNRNYAAMREVHADFVIHNPAYAQLLHHLFDHLPGPDVRERALTMINCLWQVHWFMSAVGVENLHYDQCKHVALTLAWALPNLAEQVAKSQLRAGTGAV